MFRIDFFILCLGEYLDSFSSLKNVFGRAFGVTQTNSIPLGMIQSCFDIVESILDISNVAKPV